MLLVHQRARAHIELPPAAERLPHLCSGARTQLSCRFLAGEAGLSLHDISDSDGRLAVFDGTQLVFKESEWRLLTLVRLLWRYGLAYFQLRR